MIILANYHYYQNSTLFKRGKFGYKGFNMIDDRFLRIKELSKMLGIGQSTIYRLIHQNKFPKQIKLTERTVVWRLSTINEWIAEKEKTSK